MLRARGPACLAPNVQNRSPRPSRRRAGRGLTGVSCASDTPCVAVDAAGRATAFDGSSWSGPAVIDARVAA